MSLSGTKHLLYPATLSLAVVGALAVLQGFDPTPDSASADPPYSQLASDLGGKQADQASGPLFNTTAIRQRNSQIDLLSEMLSELQSVRRLLEGGTARVTIDHLDLDSGQIQRLIAPASAEVEAGESHPVPDVDSGSVSTSRTTGSGSGTGVIRRIHGGSAASEQRSE